MQVTLSVIKAEVGSIGGRIRPSTRVFDAVRTFIGDAGKPLLIDFHVSFTGDDIAVLMTHQHGTSNAAIHELAWQAFVHGMDIAKEQGLHGAGQDLLRNSFSGNVRGMGPAVAEMEIDERPSEPFMLIAADKTGPGAFNLPLYLAFADPKCWPRLRSVISSPAG